MDACHKYYDLLELTPEATAEDIRKNYLRLKNLYSGDSIEMAALNADFSEELRQDCLSRLDDAYEKLCMRPENAKQTLVQSPAGMDDELCSWIKELSCFTGAALRTIRERMGVDLKTIFDVTRIQTQYLEDMENERFDAFRAEVYLRSYLIEYTRFLSLDTPKVLADYLPRYRAWAESRK
jgi:hypothetical protein